MDPKIANATREVFVRFFLVAQRIEYVTDKILGQDDLTAKQLLTMIVISNAFLDRGSDYAPSLGEVADELSTSYQNVRQIVKQLEKRGFLEAKRDERDKRILRLRMSDMSHKFFEKRSQNHMQSMMSLFQSLEGQELIKLNEILFKLIQTTSDVYEGSKSW